MRRGTPGGTFRHLAGLIATLCLFAQVSIFAHMLLVRHVTCPEHGELIHADEPPGSQRAPHALSTHDHGAANPAAVAESAPPSGHGHDSCFVVSERRDGLVIAAFSAPAGAAWAAERDAAPVPDALVRGSSLALYLLAPKNSPPA